MATYEAPRPCALPTLESRHCLARFLYLSLSPAEVQPFKHLMLASNVKHSKWNLDSTYPFSSLQVTVSFQKKLKYYNCIRKKESTFCTFPSLFHLIKSSSHRRTKAWLCMDVPQMPTLFLQASYTTSAASLSHPHPQLLFTPPHPFVHPIAPLTSACSPSQQPWRGPKPHTCIIIPKRHDAHHTCCSLSINRSINFDCLLQAATSFHYVYRNIIAFETSTSLWNLV